MSQETGMSLYRFCKANKLPRTTVHTRCKELGIDTSKVPALSPEDVEILKAEFLNRVKPAEAEALETYEAYVTEDAAMVPVRSFDADRVVGGLSIVPASQRAEQIARFGSFGKTLGTSVAQIAEAAHAEGNGQNDLLDAYCSFVEDTTEQKVFAAQVRGLAKGGQAFENFLAQRAQSQAG